MTDGWICTLPFFLKTWPQSLFNLQQICIKWLLLKLWFLINKCQKTYTSIPVTIFFCKFPSVKIPEVYPNTTQLLHSQRLHYTILCKKEKNMSKQLFPLDCFCAYHLYTPFEKRDIRKRVFQWCSANPRLGVRPPHPRYCVWFGHEMIIMTMWPYFWLK